MDLAISILAVGVLLVWIAGGLEVGFGARSIGFLGDQSVPAGSAPAVTVVVAARNEAGTIQGGLDGLLAQRNVRLQVVVVDDRSTDDTGSILDEVAETNDHVAAVHVTELPEGWLGKTYAMQRGAEAASAPWILFTDADVVMEPSAIAKAVAHAERRGLDHLAVTPELRMPTLGADAFGAAFVLLFARYSRPWKARDPESSVSIGIGAFNLVRTESYRAAGGHRAVRLRPDDDLMLGRVLKRSGACQDLLYGTGQVHVAWYPSLGAAVRGLEKNAFAGMGYSVIRVLVSVLALALFMTGPWAGLLGTDGIAWWASLGSCVVMSGLYVQSARRSGVRAWLFPVLPLSALVICYATLRSMTLALKRDGIRWRDTTYDLSTLRNFRV